MFTAPDTQVEKDAAVSPRWNAPPSSTRDVCNAPRPDGREEAGFSLHMTNPTPGLFVQQTTQKWNLFSLVSWTAPHLKLGSMWPPEQQGPLRQESKTAAAKCLSVSQVSHPCREGPGPLHLVQSPSAQQAARRPPKAEHLTQEHAHQLRPHEQ